MGNLYDRICSINSLSKAWEIINSKGSSGGVDGVSIEMFDGDLSRHLEALSEDLTKKAFCPNPYYEIKIPKDSGEFRTISLPSIRDKIVQQAVKVVVEPIFEKDFTDASFGYRKHQGPVKAVLRVSDYLIEKRMTFAVVCDIDNFFDTIDHDILFQKVKRKIWDKNILRLLEAWVHMGNVDTAMQWKDRPTGIPQGSVLSPLLSNVYLNDFDVFMLGRQYAFVRYADDFIVMGKDEEGVHAALRDVNWFLEKKLKLRLNADHMVRHRDEGFVFLGICFKGTEREIGEEKRAKLGSKMFRAADSLLRADIKAYKEILQGIAAYYGQLLPEKACERMDADEVQCVKDVVRTALADRNITKKDLFERLRHMEFLSLSYRTRKNKLIRDVLQYNSRLHKELKDQGHVPKREKSVKDIVELRKKEFLKRESEGFELVVSTPGAFIGRTKSSISVKNKGTKLYEAKANNLRHVFIVSQGVSISSNAVSYCVEREIPIDFLDQQGRPYARIYRHYEINVPVHLSQIEGVVNGKGAYIAKAIVASKIRNQMNLLKYYHKYHKNKEEGFAKSFQAKITDMKNTMTEIANLKQHPLEELRGKLFSIEGRAAKSYWDMIKLLLAGVLVFEGRERKGATDIVNSLLNYGYGILYTKIWGAILNSGLSPYVSYLHTGQPGKPTFVFDMIEEFRPQGVDRAIFSMINKGVEVKMDGPHLSYETKKRVAKEVLERLNAFERYRGKYFRFIEIIGLHIQGIAETLTGERTRYAPYTGKW